jgi:hypothetical protein
VDSETGSRAFSSETDTGSRRENVTIRECRAAFRFHWIGKRSRVLCGRNVASMSIYRNIEIEMMSIYRNIEIEMMSIYRNIEIEMMSIYRNIEIEGANR